MNIIYYSPHPTHDIVSEVGYATHQREVINALRAMGHTVTPVIMGGTEKGNLSPAGIPASRNSLKARIKRVVPTFIWTSLKDFQLMMHDRKAARRLEESILTHKPDLVYERSEYLQDKGVKIVKKYSIKYFIEINAPFVEEMKVFEGYSIWHSLGHRKEKNKNNAADKIFVVSTVLKEFVKSKYHINEGKIVIQPNCINLDSIHVNHAKSDLLRNELNLLGKKVVGFVGSIFPHHGVDILIDAFEMVIRQHSNSILLIVGDGSILDELKRRAMEKDLGKSVIFVGKQNHDEVFNLISVMDICVMAKSNWYGSPIKIFEYGAMGKPIIAPDTSPVRDVMENGVHGLLVQMNKNEVASAIIRLFSDPTFANNLARTFNQLILDMYTWDKAAKQILIEYSYISK